MSILPVYRNAVRILATIGYVTVQYLFIPFGALSGLIGGLILAAIWICREDDPRE